MNQMQKNEMIAEFLGAKPNHNKEYDMYQIIHSIEDGEFEKHFFFGHEMKFDSDWNWLMTAVEKIESMDFDFNILTPNVVQVIDCENMVDIIYLDMQEGTKLQSVYNTVVEFITWYNQNK